MLITQTPAMTAYQKNGKQSDEEIAVQLLDVIDDLRYRIPPTKTKKIIEYYNSSPDIRKKMNKEPSNFSSFWNDPEVKNCFNSIEIIKNLNERNKTVLIWMRDIYKLDKEALSKINPYIEKFNQEGIIAWSHDQWPLFGLKNKDTAYNSPVKEEDINWAE